MTDKQWSCGSGEVSPRVDTIINEIRSLETNMTMQIQDITRMLSGLLGPTCSKTCPNQASTVSFTTSQPFTSSSQGSRSDSTLFFCI
jgi:hypothetical protein